MTWLESQGYVFVTWHTLHTYNFGSFRKSFGSEKEGKKYPTGRGLWFKAKKSVIADWTPASPVGHYQFVFLPFTMDEKAASSIAFGVHDLTDAHATDPASFLWEPSPAGVISGHNHSLDTHNIAVTKTTTRRMGHDNGLVVAGHVSQSKMPAFAGLIDGQPMPGSNLQRQPSQLSEKNQNFN